MLDIFMRYLFLVFKRVKECVGAKIYYSCLDLFSSAVSWSSAAIVSSFFINGLWHSSVNPS